MTVSIIIAAKEYGKNLDECVDKCLKLDYPAFEIVIALDNKKEIAHTKIKVISTGEVLPAEKRDLASLHAQGEILAFIDDDAYPEKDWLKNAVKDFEDSQVGAVGGPAVTPPHDNLWQKASGKIYESLIVGGPYRYRYVKDKRREVIDYPSCNLLVRKDVFLALKGFDTSFWPGEDTKLCLEVVDKLQKKIIYDPNVLVYHHRRPVFLPHLKQIANYALHRGYFAKKYPKSSLKVSYFLPSLLFLAVLTGFVLSVFIPYFWRLYSTSLFIYLGAVLFFSLNKEIKTIPLVFLGIILSHLTYGLFFLKGIFTKKLKEE